MSIATVRGVIAPKVLGFCQSHEHVYIEDGYPAQMLAHQRINNETLSGEELWGYAGAGGCAIVDAQPGGCGRNAEVLSRLSESSGVHIIASTGFHRMTFYPKGHWVYNWDEDRLAQWMLDELQNGMYVDCDTAPPAKQTGIRAGQIKAALDEGTMTPQVDKLFRAAAWAAKESGAPLMVHIEQSSNPVALADRLEKSGVRPDKTIFCHMDRSVADLGIHKGLCARGIYMEYDTIARPRHHSDAREIDIVMEMLLVGHGRRLLMGLDTTRARLRSYRETDAPGLCYILERFIPEMERRGIAREQVEALFVKNPARAFSMDGQGDRTT